jgi:hypothetical protein
LQIPCNHCTSSSPSAVVAFFVAQYHDFNIAIGDDCLQDLGCTR